MRAIRIKFAAILIVLAAGIAAPATGGELTLDDCLKMGPHFVCVGLRKSGERTLATHADSPPVGDSLRNPTQRQKLEQIIARRKAAGAADPRIRVTDDGDCGDGLPTCYDGPSNTIIIAGDPTLYLYRTKPQPDQPSTFQYSWDRAIFREVEKAYVWWVEGKTEGSGTEAYDQEYLLPPENEHFWDLRQEPHRLCGHAIECLELKAPVG